MRFPAILPLGDTQTPGSGGKSQEGGVLPQGAGQGEDRWIRLGGAGMGWPQDVDQDSPFRADSMLKLESNAQAPAQTVRVEAREGNHRFPVKQQGIVLASPCQRRLTGVLKKLG